MLYGVSGPDGTGESERGMFRLRRLNTSFISTRHWVQASLGPRIEDRCATIVLCRGFFPSPLCSPLYSILSPFLSSCRRFFPLFHLPFSPSRCPFFCSPRRDRIRTCSVIHRSLHSVCSMHMSELSRTTDATSVKRPTSYRTLFSF